MNGDNELIKDAMVLGCVVVPFIWKFIQTYNLHSKYEKQILSVNSPSTILQTNELELYFPTKKEKKVDSRQLDAEKLKDNSKNKHKKDLSDLDKLSPNLNMLDSPFTLGPKFIPLLRQIKKTNQLEYTTDGNYLNLKIPLKGTLISSKKVSSLDPQAKVLLLLFLIAEHFLEFQSQIFENNQQKK